VSFRFLGSGVVGLGVLVSLAPFACSSPAKLGGQGASCTTVTDCQDGLICITPKGGGSGSCSSNVGSVQQLPPIPDAGPAMQGSDAAEFEDSPGILIPTDTGAPQSD
jgi:hypothetical protein